MANQSFSLFTPKDSQGNEIYIGYGAQGNDSMISGYPLQWSTQSNNEGRLYRKSEFVFETNGYMIRDGISKIATIKQKGQPIFSTPTITPESRSGNTLTSVVSPISITEVISLTEGTPLTNDYFLNIVNKTNAQWLEISISYNYNDTYSNEGVTMTQALLGDSDEDVYEGGNRIYFLNRIRESLYYEFPFAGVDKPLGYQTNDSVSSQKFKMYYKITTGQSPTSDFTDFMGIGTTVDFDDYIKGEIANGNDEVEESTYTQINITHLSSTELELVGASSSINYQEYYKNALTYGETSAFKCNITFNSNPIDSNETHYFRKFADSNDECYLGQDKVFIFHINIKPRGFAKKWNEDEQDYNNYYQWNYTPYDIKVVIMTVEPTPYLEFNNSYSSNDDSVLLGAQSDDTNTLPVNSNMQWNINSQANTGVYDVTNSEIINGEPLYIESNNQ